MTPKTFALVHGAWHGGWCWERLVPELERLGHRAVAPDLPCDEPDADVEAYATAVLDGLAGESGSMVVVGHSLGGLTIPLVAARRPVERLVFLAALVPQPGETLGDVLARVGDALPADFGAGQEPTETGGSTWKPGAATPFLYDDCDPVLAEQAEARLRSQHWAATSAPYPLAAWPDVPSSYIVCAGDRTVAPEAQRRLARDVLGVEPVEIAGGHSPFLSRPQELAELLVEVAA